MKKLDQDEFELSTGRKFSANCHIIGICEEDDGTFSLHEGYDGGISTEQWYHGEDADDEDRAENWTVAEKVELADYMIELWTRYRYAVSHDKEGFIVT